MDYITLQKMNRFAKFWDLYANSGEFKNFMLWFKASAEDSFFWKFFNFSEFLSSHFSETHSISLMNLAEKAWLYLKDQGVDEELAMSIIEKDFCFGAKRRDKPSFLKSTTLVHSLTESQKRSSLTSRQQKHIN